MKTSQIARILGIVIVISLAAGCGGGGGVTPPTPTGSVSGAVTDRATSSPVAGAAAAITGTTITATTDTTGRYLLSGVPTGSRTVTVAHSNYVGRSQTVEVQRDATVTANFALDRALSSTNPALVTPDNYVSGTAALKQTTPSGVAYFVAVAPGPTGGSFTLSALGTLTASQPQGSRAPALLSSLNYLGNESGARAVDKLTERLPAPRPRVPPAGPQPAVIGSTRTFWVYTNGSFTTQQQITATLEGESAHALLYVDNGDLATFPLNTVSDYLNAWESAIWPRLTTVFGLPVNPYNSSGTGQIIILFSSTVGTLVGAGGYFTGLDLFSETVATSIGRHSNEADMIYMNIGMPVTFSKATLAHEFQHLINFSQHRFVFNGSSESTWINEGLSMVSEDVAGFGYQMNTVQGIAASFFADPTAVSLWNWPTSIGSATPYYGEAWLFFRYVADRSGESLLGRLVQTNLTGAANIEAATGEALGVTLTSQGIAMINSTRGLGLAMPYTYTSLSLSTIGTLTLGASTGSLSVNGGGFNLTQLSTDGQAYINVTVTVGTITPYLGLFR